LEEKKDQILIAVLKWSSLMEIYAEYKNLSTQNGGGGLRCSTFILAPQLKRSVKYGDSFLIFLSIEKFSPVNCKRNFWAPEAKKLEVGLPHP
jgi:hypothetical protein